MPRRWPPENMKSETGSNKWRRCFLMSARKPLLNGVRSSRTARQNSNSKFSSSRRKLEKLLGASFDAFNSNGKAVCRRNFIFHMTDWIDDLHQLIDLYEHPEKFDKKSANQIVAGFLSHAPWHILAAARLMLDHTPEDIFKE